MDKDQSGIGMVGLLITLAVVVTIVYLSMKRQISTRPGPHPSNLSDQAVRKQLESQGLQAPAQVNLNSAEDVSQHITAQIGASGDQHMKAVDCAGENTEGAGCRIDPQPSSAPSSLAPSLAPASSAALPAPTVAPSP